MRKNNYILGGGPAGLIAAFYNPEFQIIDKNPMGQLNLPFVPGPRILKVDEYSKRFIDRLGIEYTTKKIRVGYSFNGIDVVSEADQKFKEEYSFITRGTTKIETSFLSSGENEIEVFASENGDDLYYKVFAVLTDLLKDRIVGANVSSINTKNRTVGVEINDAKCDLMYDDIVSTLNINIMFKLLNLEPLNLAASKKHFIQCEFTNPEDIENAKKYHYIYSCNRIYTRKTYFKDNFRNYIVYEFCQPYEEILDVPSIQGNKVIKHINNIPIQINNSIDFRNIQGIDLVGRFAQWNHSIKANEIIAKYERQISRNI